MKIRNNIIRRLKTSRPNAVTSVIITLLLLLTSCTNKPEPYSILEFTGTLRVKNYTKSMLMGSFLADSTNTAALLASDGDLILSDEESVFYYRKPSQNRYHLESVNGVNYINDKVVSITIPRNEGMIPWFKQMKPSDLSDLQSLKIPSKLPESYTPYLNELVKIKPDLSLSSSGEKLNDLAKYIENFNPRFLSGVTIYENDYNLLSGYTNLELLFATFADSISTIPLPAMPQLKQLFMNLEGTYGMKNDLLINNKQIEKLIVMRGGTFNFSLIEPLINLKELTLFGNDTIENPDLIKNHKHLELLSLGFEYKPNSILDELPALRWMSFSSEATQSEFDSFIEHHPNLEVLDIYGNTEIKSLKPLLGLKKIYGLTINDAILDTATIKKLKNLKYLSIPNSVLLDSLISADLHKSLPFTIIAPNEGVCLGSGWLLLIIPFILFFVIVKRKKAVEAQSIK